MIDPSIPQPLQDAIAGELESDEKVVWSGMPKPWCFNKPTVHRFLFGIAWTALDVIWMAGATGFKIQQINQGQDLIPWAGFLFFFVIGIALLFSPLWTFRKSLKTVYVITDRRAITMDGGWTTTTRSYPPERLSEMFRKEHRDGTGDIVFERHISKDSDGDRHVEELGFLHIRDAKSVEAQLKELAGVVTMESDRPYRVSNGRMALEALIDPSITPSLREAIARELECDEEVVWSAMPKPRYFGGPAAGRFGSGLGLTVFSVFFAVISVGSMPQFNSLDLFFLVGSLTFFSIGIAMLSSPLWAYRKSLKTVYVIADRRAITIDGGWSTTIRSYPPEKLTRIFRKEHEDGTGDVTISRQAWRDPEDDRQMEELGFLRIADAESVEAKLRGLAEQGERVA